MEKRQLHRCFPLATKRYQLANCNKLLTENRRSCFGLERPARRLLLPPASLRTQDVVFGWQATCCAMLGKGASKAGRCYANSDNKEFRDFHLGRSGDIPVRKCPRLGTGCWRRRWFLECKHTSATLGGDRSSAILGGDRSSATLGGDRSSATRGGDRSSATLGGDR
jgi:hypothetical protein